MTDVTPIGRVARAVLRWFAAIRTRLLVVNLIVVAVPVVGIAFARLHERQLLAALERDLIHQAAVVRAALAREVAPPATDAAATARLQAQRSAVLADAARTTRARLQLLDAGGRVIADSRPAGAPAPIAPAAPRADHREVRAGPAGHREVAAGPADHREVAAGPADHREVAAGPADHREVRAALAGRYGAATRITPRGRRVELAIALPWRDRAGHVVGAVRVTGSTAPVMRQLVALRHRLFELLLIAAAVTAALSLFLAATIARPLATLTRAAARIAAGDRTARLELARHDEIGQLSRAVDRMAGELDRRAREQRALAADISHELKTPLTAIRGATELLRDGAAADPAARDRFLAMILDDAARLDRLVTRLLELARLEADATPAEPLELVGLVRDLHDDRPGAPVVIAGDARVPVVARADAIAAALDNLITNARQHAAAGTAVTVTVTAAAGRARVAVHNHGPALSLAVQAKVWQRFFTTRGDRGGSGLGLAIVRAVAEGHGGAVGLTSSAADGTTFWIELPGRAGTQSIGAAEPASV